VYEGLAAALTEPEQVGEAEADGLNVVVQKYDRVPVGVWVVVRVDGDMERMEHEAETVDEHEKLGVLRVFVRVGVPDKRADDDAEAERVTVLEYVTVQLREGCCELLGVKVCVAVQELEGPVRENVEVATGVRVSVSEGEKERRDAVSEETVRVRERLALSLRGCVMLAVQVTDDFDQVLVGATVTDKD